MISYLPMILMFVLFALGVPVAYSLAIAGIVYFVFINHDLPLTMIIQSLMTNSTSYVMLAIPFFITAGVIMSYSGISKKLLDFCDVLTGHMRGGLAQCNVLLSVFMGGISGSPIADCAFESKVLVPQMEAKGYSKGFSAAITAASSVITPIIPPGICLIIYATVTNQSIGDMFLAGYLPGILLGVALMFTVWLVAKKRHMTPDRETRATGREILKQFKSSIWALVMPFGIIMGLRLGFFTPTECGAVCVLYSILVGVFVYRELKVWMIPRIVFESVVSTAGVMFIMCAAGLFSKYLSWEQIPQMVTSFFMGLTQNKYLFLLIVNLLLLFMGMFFDANASLVIFPPLLAPVAQSLGIDLVHFGLIMCLNITIGGITPPFGILMFTAANATKCKISEFVRELVPFLIAALAVLFLVTYVEEIPLFLVNLFGE